MVDKIPCSSNLVCSHNGHPHKDSIVFLKMAFRTIKVATDIRKFPELVQQFLKPTKFVASSP